MATPQNDSSVRLYATVPRNINPTLNNALILIATPSSFQVNSAGSVGTPSLIPLTVSRIGLTGAVTWSVSGATLTTSGDTATLAFSSMLGASATVSVSLIKDGITYTSNVCTITKVSDGAAGSNGTPGTNGARGAGHYYVVGNPWTDALANAATPGANVVDDVVTVYTSGVYVLEKKWDGTNWVAQGTVVDGNLLVSGSVQTAALGAYAVTAKKLLIGTSDNIVPDPAFRDLAWWGRTGYGVNDYSAADVFWKTAFSLIILPATGAFADTFSEFFPSTPGAVYRFEFQVYVSADFVGQASIYAHIPGQAFSSMGGPTRGYNWTDGLPVQFDSGSTKGAQTFSVVGSLADGSLRNRMQIRLKTQCTAGYIEFGSLSITRVANSVLIEDGAVTAPKIFVDSLTAITANLGTATIASGGYLRSGQTAYNTGTGFWLGSVSGVPQFSIGNPSGAHMRWDGSNLYIQGETKATFSVAITGSLSSTVANGAVTYGTRLSTVTGGVGTLAYQWYISGTQANDLNANYFASSGTTSSSCTIRGSANNMQIIGTHVLVVTEVATGRTCTATVGHNPTHGTYP